MSFLSNTSPACWEATGWRQADFMLDPVNINCHLVNAKMYFCLCWFKFRRRTDAQIFTLYNQGLQHRCRCHEIIALFSPSHTAEKDLI